MKLYDITVKNKKQEDISLNQYTGKVLLIVNTATHCGFTNQYTQLQQLHDTYHNQGLAILDFPCNQFKHQAPGSDEEISQFCSLNYGVTFDQFAKIDVNGETEDPLYTFLKSEKTGLFNEEIKWNFTKFLVDRKGNVVKRYAPTTNPLEIEKDIVTLLQQGE